jgi:hypothetical protein
MEAILQIIESKLQQSNLAIANAVGQKVEIPWTFSKQFSKNS